MYMISNYAKSYIRDEITNQSVAVIGAVLNRYPDAELDIVKIYTNEMDSIDSIKGKEICEKYGLDQFIQQTAISLTFFQINKLLVFFILAIFLLALCFFLIHFKFFKRIYDFSQDTSINIDRLMKGEFDVAFDAYSEGAISGLASQLKLLARRTSSSFESLNHEKDNLKEYLTNISHQLKTPLASLRIFLDLMSENVSDYKEGKNYSIENEMEYIAKSNLLVDRMEWLINGLLGMSRIECSAVKMNLENNDLMGTLDIVLQELWFKVKAKQLEIRLNAESQHINLPHDRSWLGQAVENILKNCIEYSPENGVIQIHVEETEVLVRIKISDNGPGIAEGDIPKIFNRFFTGKVIKRNGVGVGLALAKLIVEKHHGIISAENAEQGGAVFTISIPKFE